MKNEIVKVTCIDTDIPRVDGKGPCQGITVGKHYDVVDDNGIFYTIVNDVGKAANYIKIRFEPYVNPQHLWYTLIAPFHKMLVVFNTNVFLATNYSESLNCVYLGGYGWVEARSVEVLTKSDITKFIDSAPKKPKY